MNLSLIKEGSISSLEELIEIEGIDLYSLSFYMVANYDDYSEDMEELNNILERKDVKITTFIAEFLEFQFENSFCHVSCFENENTVHYKIYQTDSELQEVWLSIVNIQDTLEKIEAKNELLELETIKSYLEKIVGVLNE